MNVGIANVFNHNDQYPSMKKDFCINSELILTRHIRQALHPAKSVFRILFTHGKQLLGVINVGLVESAVHEGGKVIELLRLEHGRC